LSAVFNRAIGYRLLERVFNRATASLFERKTYFPIMFLMTPTMTSHATFLHEIILV
jgi:hypothetical protein